MTMSPYAPDAVSAETVDYLNLIARRPLRGPVALGEAVWQADLAPCFAPVLAPGEAFVLRMEWGGASLRLIAPPAMLALLVAHQFPDVLLHTLPEELALAGFELAWSECRQRLETLSGRKVRLVAAGSAVPQAPAAGEFAFTLNLDSAAAADGVQASLVVDAAALPMLALLAHRAPAPAPTRRAPDTPVVLRLELGAMSLRADALRRLALHDVLLPDEPIDPERPAVWLRPDARHLVRANVQPDGLAIVSTLERTLMPTSPDLDADDTPDDVSDEALASLDQLEIRLTFDLGHKSLTLGELAQIQPGQVFPLDAQLPRLVAIRANGRLVGRGELLRIDDRVGVRVVALAGAATE